MATSDPTQGVTSILNAAGNAALVANNVAAEALAIINAGNVANTKDLYPVNCLGAPTRLLLAGPPTIEKQFHFAFEQGRMLESSIGDAMSWIQTKKVDLDEKIQHYLSLHTLAIDGQFSDHIRAIKYAADAIKFIQQIRTYSQEIIALVAAIQANIMALQAVESRMLNMIRANMNALANLLQEICNWGLPSLPSLSAQLGQFYHWNGFNFCAPSGFKFNSNLTFNFNFNYNQCGLRIPNYGSLFTLPPTSLTDGTVTFAMSSPIPPMNGVYGDPTQFTNPTYIAQMKATTTLVLNPDVPPITGTQTSLPNPAAIISNYSLTPASYQQNITSAVASLNTTIIQPTAANYTSGVPTAADQANMRSALIQSVNLSQIVQTSYDPNTVAAWLFYLELNRAGRAGTWISSFQAEYTAVIAPSLAYLAANNIPWNTVLGGTATVAAPAAIPLIAALEADTTNNLKWRLSYIEASLLGYVRSTTWDAAADSTFLSGFSGSDVNYLSTAISSATATIELGVGTATYPVKFTYPTSMATVLTEVIAIATANIANTPTYQSNRPQFNYTYDAFANAVLVDRYTQFWRVFNANFTAFLAGDPYVVGFIANYPETLDGAIDPLASATNLAAYTALDTDATSRNRSWTPGSDLLPITKATAVTFEYTPPTDLNNGWTSGTLSPSAFLTRPDVQAQPLPVQFAMLRTNEGFQSLMTLQTNLQSAISTAVQNANLSIQEVSLPGWEVENSQNIAVPPGAAGIQLSFDTVDFDQTNYIQDPMTYVIQSTDSYILNLNLNWDTTGATATRTATILQNGVVIGTVSAASTDQTPFITQISTELPFTKGDVITVFASHTAATSQNILAGSIFLGLLDQGTVVNTTPAPVTPSTSNSYPYNSGTTFPIYTALTLGTDGNVYPIDPTLSAPTPYLQSAVPLVFGIALEAAGAAGVQIPVNTVFGSQVMTTGTNWTVGGLIYAVTGGQLTQDYQGTVVNLPWIVCIGRADTAESFVYEPQVPTNYVQYA